MLLKITYAFDRNTGKKNVTYMSIVHIEEREHGCFDYIDLEFQLESITNWCLGIFVIHKLEVIDAGITIHTYLNREEDREEIKTFGKQFGGNPKFQIHY